MKSWLAWCACCCSREPSPCFRGEKVRLPPVRDFRLFICKNARNGGVWAAVGDRQWWPSLPRLLWTRASFSLVNSLLTSKTVWGCLLFKAELIRPWTSIINNDNDTNNDNRVKRRRENPTSSPLNNNNVSLPVGVLPTKMCSVYRYINLYIDIYKYTNRAFALDCFIAVYATYSVFIFVLIIYTILTIAYCILFVYMYILCTLLLFLFFVLLVRC